MSSMIISQAEAIVLLRCLPGATARRVGDPDEFVPEDQHDTYDSLETRGLLRKNHDVLDEDGEECWVSTTTKAGKDSLRLYIKGVGLRG